MPPVGGPPVEYQKNKKGNIAMPIVTVFNGTFCNAEAVVRNLLETSGGGTVSDDDVAAKAAERFDMPENKVRLAFCA